MNKFKGGKVSSTVCSKISVCLVETAVQVSIGTASGMLFTKVWPAINVLDGALVGTASGAFSGFAGRAICMCDPHQRDPQDNSMRKVMLRVSNTLFTITLVGISYFICYVNHHYGDLKGER